MDTFELDKKYIVTYWITFLTYIIVFAVLMLTIGYSFTSFLENPWLRRVGLVIMLGGWLIWYIGRKKLGYDSVDIDPLGDTARKIIHPKRKKVREIPTDIIRKGIYGKTRHPQYWGTVLFYIGLSIALSSIPALIASVVLVLPTHIWRAAVEEKMLLRVFGEKYQQYKAQVKI